MGAIARILGNSVRVAERHYVRFSPDHLRAAMATLDTPIRKLTAPPTAPPLLIDFSTAGTIQLCLRGDASAGARRIKTMQLTALGPQPNPYPTPPLCDIGWAATRHPFIRGRARQIREWGIV